MEETTGVYVHSYDNSEVTWFGPKWSCKCVGGNDLAKYKCSGGGDAFLVGLLRDQHWTGAWCDWPTEREFPFICEGLI